MGGFGSGWRRDEEQEDERGSLSVLGIFGKWTGDGGVLAVVDVAPLIITGRTQKQGPHERSGVGWWSVRWKEVP